MNPLVLLGGAALWIATRKKKPSQPAVAPTRVAAANASQQAAELSVQQPAAAMTISLRKQLKMIRGLFNQLSFADGRIKVGGLAPFNFSENYPSPWQLAVLYSVDPEIEINEEGVGRFKVKDLLVDALLEDPQLDAVARGVNPEGYATNIPLSEMKRSDDLVVANAILLLPQDRVTSFAAQLLEDAAPLAKTYGLENKYDLLLKDLATSMEGGKPSRLLISRAGEIGGMAEEIFGLTGGRQFNTFLRNATDVVSWGVGHTKPYGGQPQNRVLSIAMRNRASVTREVAAKTWFDGMNQVQRENFNRQMRTVSSKNVPAELLEQERLAKRAEQQEWDNMVSSLRRRFL